VLLLLESIDGYKMAFFNYNVEHTKLKARAAGQIWRKKSP